MSEPRPFTEGRAFTLTGPPKIGALTMPLASVQTPVRLTWDDSESVWRRYASGRMELVERRQRARLTMGWRALPYETLVALLVELEAPVLVVLPRTWRDGDPELDEEPIEMRLTSPKPRLDALYLQGVDVVLEFEGLRAESTLPGLDVEGGFYVSGWDGDHPLLSAWGRARVSIDADGYGRLGDAIMLALRTRPDPDGYRIITLTEPPPGT